MSKPLSWFPALLLGALLLAAPPAAAERISDVKNTKHNLSAGAPTGNTVKATTEDEVCVFCHTPHAATQGMTPLWNKEQSTGSYTPYSSTSLDATGLGDPGGSSKLCLSCHDGTIAIGQVNVLNGASTTIAMNGTESDKMPHGPGAGTGFTRKLGVNMTNDHPISFTYNDDLANTDGELRVPSTSGGDPKLIDSRAVGYKPKAPLENSQLQCTTCHDPHIKETDAAQGNIKFLRLRRFQGASPGTSFDATVDQVCLACHTKAGWELSAHALPAVANETYTDNAATIREFPQNLQVWQAGCLNCHDTHTVEGSRRLLREGTTGAANTAGYKEGGTAAIEETCYQCHSSTGGTTTGGGSSLVLNGQDGTSFEVPNIMSDFKSKYRMPIDKANEQDLHKIGDSPLDKPGKDFIEKPELLANRHTECSDCHNPHRVRKNSLFNGEGTTTRGTHSHAAGHSNIASGVLRGSWGVEPVYESQFKVTFGERANSFTVKRGDPATASTDVSEDWVTREYQICLKCHSSYAYGTTPPSLGYTGGTSGTVANGLTKYTDQAMEFAAPSDDTGEPKTGSNTMTGVPAVSNNHRSWHPVMAPTGRTPGARGGSGVSGMWRAPWDGNVGTQTMYCSDCHGSAVTSTTSVVPDTTGKVWGPHGSENPFILKGAWRDDTTARSNALCTKCHNPTGSSRSGFCCEKSNNLHAYHNSTIGRLRCNWCHVAVPHGWKNKALLVNLNKVGPEAGETSEVSKSSPYTKEPYYLRAYLRIRTFKAAGSWQQGDCGSSSSSGKSWMRSACSSPP